MDSVDQGSGSGLYQESSQESAYVPIRVLGRGAFGEAVLYRKVTVSMRGEGLVMFI